MHPFLKGLALLVPAIGTMLVLVLGVGVVTAITRQSRLRRLARARNPQAAFAEFCAAFPNQTEDLLQSIYSSLQAMLQVDNFPVRVDDDLWRTLELDQGNLESGIESFFERRGQMNPTFSSADAPLETVRDLVQQFYLAKGSVPV